MRYSFVLPAALLISLMSACATAPVSSPGGARPAITKKATSASPKTEEAEADQSASYGRYLGGLLAERRGDYASALELFERSITENGGPIQAYEKGAALLLRMGKIERALAMVEAGLQARPDYLPLLTSLGSIHSSLGQYVEAVTAFKQALILDPDRKESHIYLAIAQFQSGAIDAAEATLTTYVKRFPDDPLGHYYMARAQGQLKQYKKAEATFRKLTKKYPDFDKGFDGLAALYRSQRRLPEAVAVYKSYLKGHPGADTFARKLADTYLQQKSYGKAIDTIEELVGEGPIDTDLRVKLGLTHLRQAEVTGEAEEYKKALAQLQLVRKQHPEARQISYYVATIFERLNLIPEAIAAWSAMIDPKEGAGNRDLYLKIAELHEKEKETQKSLDAVKKALKLDPSDAEVHYFSGLLLNTLNRNKEAVKAFTTAIDLNPASDKYYFSLGVVYEKQKEYEKCIAAMKKAIELKPDHADALNYLGYLYAELNRNLDEAEQSLLAAIKIEPDNGYFLDSLAWIYYRQGRFAKALKTERQSVRSIPPDPVVLEHLGDIHRAMGRRADAIDAYKRSLAAKSDDESVDNRDAVRKKLVDLQNNPLP